jgi:spore germination protein KB
MTNKIVISPRQYAALVSLHIIGSAILIIPSSLANMAKQDAWIASLLALTMAMLILPLYRALGSRFGGADMVGFAERLLGRFAGSAAMLLFILGVPFIIASFTLRNIGDFITTQIMPETPIQAIHILIMCVVVLGVRLGLEPIARTAEIFFPAVLFLIFFLICLVSPEIKPVNLLPVFENGFLPVARGGLTMLVFPFLESAFLIMLLPSVHNSKEGGSALTKGVLLGGAALVLVTALSILVHGTSNTARQMFPSYILARKINIGGIIDRIEIIVAIVWFVTNYIRLTLLFYISIAGISSVLRLKEYRSLTYPMGLVLLTLSIVIFPNAAIDKKLVSVWPFYGLLWGIAFPLSLYLIAAMRGVRLPGAGPGSG